MKVGNKKQQKKKTKNKNYCRFKFEIKHKHIYLQSGLLLLFHNEDLKATCNQSYTLPSWKLPSSWKVNIANAECISYYFGFPTMTSQNI